MIEYLVLIVIIITFAIASLEDIKKREVYDYINFALAFFMIAVAIFHSLILWQIDPIKYVTFGMILGFGLGAVLFYFGIWGGGDAKFLLGFSAASFYLMQFGSKQVTNISEVYEIAMRLLSNFFELFFTTFLKFLIILDIIFLLLIVIQFAFSKKASEKKDLIFLLLILVLLSIGLFFDYGPLVLALIGFASFILIFFAREGIFSSVYFKYKKHMQDLKEGDLIDDDIHAGGRIIVKHEDHKKLSKEDIGIIKQSIKSHTKTKDVKIKRALPYSTLIGLNFVMYLFRAITLDDQNLQILSFMFEFLFFSFIAGGVLAVVVVFYYFIKNFKQIHFKFSSLEWAILSIALAFSIVSFIFFPRFLFVSILIPLYLFVKMAMAIESVAFIKKKNLKEVVLGDWIVQDIEVNNRTIYSKEDFKIGVDEFQLAKIRKLSETHSSLKKILVKDGIAFLPALLLGFILTILV